MLQKAILKYPGAAETFAGGEQDHLFQQGLNKGHIIRS